MEPGDVAALTYYRYIQKDITVASAISAGRPNAVA
jgi:hypothetical protein